MDDDINHHRDGNSDSCWELRAYCHHSECCGKLDLINSSGYRLKGSDHIKNFAVPSSNFAFHTTIHISGGWNQTDVVEDGGGVIKGKRLDIYCKVIKWHFNSLQEKNVLLFIERIK